MNLAVSQDQLALKMSWYGKANPSTNLFVHFDKNVYSNKETIYFTGYLLKEGVNPLLSHRIMAVSLIRDADSTLVLESKFSMQNGLSFGSINIPDSILTGNYRLIAHTDRLTNGIPDLIFEQAITIKTNIDPAFKASMKLIDPIKDDKLHRILLAVTTKENQFLKKPTLINYKYGNVNSSAKTDLSGQLLISLPIQENLTDPNLYVKLKNVKDSSYISMALPQTKSKATVKFYPEGGNLIEGLYCNVGFEVKDQQRMPLALKAYLYKNNKVVDTIETSNYGIGKFRLLIEKDANYTLKLAHTRLADSSYHLPKPIAKGLAIVISEAIVQDTLKLSLKTNDAKKLLITVHNFREGFLNFPFDMETNSRTIKIPLTDVPKGLNSITITDSLGRPLAERLFFAHYSNAEKVHIDLDHQIYNQRQKVNLKLKLNNVDERAIVSIAVVQNSRLELKKMNDIDSYSYIKNELNNLPINLKGIAFNDKNYLEEILLVKGWRRYTWQDLQLAKPSDTLFKTDSLKLLGSVTKDKKKLTKPVLIGTYGNKTLQFINTNADGSFAINDEQLRVEEDKKMYLFLTSKDMPNHIINVTNPYPEVIKKLTKILPNEGPILPSTLLNNEEMVLKGNEKAIRLKEVVINNKNAVFAWGANSCGDYVCFYNILNCPNHITDGRNTHPIVGKQYLNRGGLKPYKGCNDKSIDGFYMLDGINTEKEFYVSDYSQPEEPAFFSTIYWNYATLLNGEKETELSFYTSDINGKFRIVVQGVGNEDVVYGEQFFEVKPKVNP